jgi:DNA-binding FrmR family transcriptional regulator
MEGRAEPLPTSRYHRDNEDLLARLSKIEGQVRGVQRMVREDRYCVDILVQLAAIKAAVDRVGLSLLESHMRGCVARAMQSGDGAEAVGELMDVIRQFIR